MCTHRRQLRYMCHKDYCYSTRLTAVASSVAGRSWRNHIRYALPCASSNNNSCTMQDLKRVDVFLTFCSYATLALVYGRIHYLPAHIVESHAFRHGALFSAEKYYAEDVDVSTSSSSFVTFYVTSHMSVFRHLSFIALPSCLFKLFSLQFTAHKVHFEARNYEYSKCASTLLTLVKEIWHSSFFCFLSV